MRIFIFLINVLTFLNFNFFKAQNDSIPKHDTLIVNSKILGENRMINVWKPPNYSETSSKLPVLYMLDGGIKEDFPHLANTIADLIASRKIPPMILVGIENTQRRRDLTGITLVKEDKEIAPIVGGSENFRNFLTKELIPEIEKKYKTTDKRGIIGESLAGLFVTETLLLTPDLFDDYIAFDPSLWWNNAELVKNSPVSLAKFPTNQKKFWFAGSSEKTIYKNTRALEKVLYHAKVSGLKFKYSDEPKEHHDTIFRAVKEKALIWTFSK